VRRKVPRRLPAPVRSSEPAAEGEKERKPRPDAEAEAAQKEAEDKRYAKRRGRGRSRFTRAGAPGGTQRFRWESARVKARWAAKGARGRAHSVGHEKTPSSRALGVDLERRRGRRAPGSRARRKAPTRSNGPAALHGTGKPDIWLGAQSIAIRHGR